jgi:hypothetical protein
VFQARPKIAAAVTKPKSRESMGCPPISMGTLSPPRLGGSPTK